MIFMYILIKKIAEKKNHELVIENDSVHVQKIIVFITINNHKKK